MAHGINKELGDVVLSNKGTEWHRLAIVEEVLDKETLRKNGLLCPLFEEKPLRLILPQGKEMAVTAGMEIALSDLPNGTILKASESAKIVGVDLSSHPNAQGDNPAIRHTRQELAIPKDGYQIISNEMIWELVMDSLQGVDGATVTTAGSICGYGKFFISVELDGSGYNIGKTIGGANDRHRTFFNFLTSHTGSMTVECFPSGVRVVCDNTFEWARLDMLDEVWKIRHTANGLTALGNLGNTISNYLTMQDKMAEFLRELKKIKMDKKDFVPFTAQHFHHKAGTGKGRGVLSAQALRASVGIADRAIRGKGNSGQSLFDQLQGVTEFYTHGRGATGASGKKPEGKRFFDANFGSARDTKANFLLDLQSEPFEPISEAVLNDRIKEGRELVKETQAHRENKQLALIETAVN